MRLKRFNDWHILPKILSISVASVILIDAIILFYFLPLIENKILQGQKTSIQRVVDVAYSLVAEYDRQVETGILTMFEARTSAALDIENLRYSNSEYFWINDMSGRMIMHPIKPELEGKDVSNVKDPTGKYLFREFVKICREKGGGLVEYMWPKPGESRPVPKISYVRGYRPWGWVIGSGVYIDDVKADIASIRDKIVLGTAVFALLSLLLAFYIGSQITQPLKEVVGGLKEIAQGRGDMDLVRRMQVKSADEIGELSCEFNGLMDSIVRVATFKRVIEEDETLQEVYSRLGTLFKDELGLAETVILSADQGGHKMAPVYPAALGEDQPLCNPESLTDRGFCRAQRTGHIICSTKTPGVCKEFPDPTRDYCCIPMVVGGSTVGVARLTSQRFPAGSAEASRFQEGVLSAEYYLKQSLSAIQAKRLMQTLQDSALTDPLTGLHNRRFLEECIENMVAGVLRRGKILGLLMCDVDYFKQVNDQHGHDVGDTVLKGVAGILRSSVRNADLVLRFGGEEFLVVLVDVAAGQTVEIGEKIRKAVESAIFSTQSGGLKKTISIGVSEFPGDSASIWQAIKFADVSLYRAKEEGRNRSVRFEEGMWTEQNY